MLAYNPTVNDQSGQIYAGYQTKAADITAAGNQALANGIMQGATSAIGGGLSAATGFNATGMIKDQNGNSIAGLGEAFNKMQDTASKANGNLGMAQALADMYKQYGTKPQQQDFAAGLKAVGNNQDKQSGFLATHLGNVQSMQTGAIYNQRAASNAAAATQRSNAGMLQYDGPTDIVW